MGDVLIRQCRPSEFAPEIRGLFERTGKPRFSEVYDRVYLRREKRGLRSWVGLSGDRAVMHISVAPEAFSDGVATLTCGLLGDLMADETARDFWAPLKLVRKMVSDVRKDRLADFLLTTYVPAAEGVFKAAGFRPFAVLRRWVFPLFWPYRQLRRALLGPGLGQITAVPFGDGWSEVQSASLRSPGCFRPLPHADYYLTRIPRIEYPSGTWILVGPSTAPDAVVLVSPMSNGELRIADVLWRHEGISLAHVLASVARWAAAAEYNRLVLTTIDGTQLTAAARGAGFISRSEIYPIMLAQISAVPIPPPERWEMTAFVVTSW